MFPRIPHRNRPRNIAVYLLSIALFLNLLPLSAFAAGSRTPQPASTRTTENQPQEDSQEGGEDARQQESPRSVRQAGNKRSPLAKSPVIREFTDWVEQYKISGSVSASEQEGQELARQRRAVMAQLIKDDPQSAVELAVPAHVRRRMPAEIQQEVEEAVSGYGDYLVMVFDEADARTGEFTRSRTQRKVVLDGKTYEARVYGYKLGMTTKLNIALRGVVIDGVIALAESPVRVLEAEERDVLTGGQGVDVEVGGKVQHFESEEQVERFKEKLKKQELTIGPNSAVPTSKGDATAEATAGGEGDEATTNSVWTEGAKTVLVMRVDFSDMQGEPTDFSGPLTTARAQALIDTDCDEFYKDNSYDKTSMSGQVTSVLRMPQTAAYYGATGADREDELLNDARAAANAAGFNPANFDLDIVAFSDIAGFTFAGLGYLGAKGSWLNGSFGQKVTSHELGHNYGLSHANFWETADDSVIGNGTSREYGDRFDQMGGGYDPSHHFNAWFKNLLGWLPNADVANVTATGAFRLQAYDSKTATGRRALKIQRDADTFYWVEFRQATAGYPTTLNGAVIHWGYTSVRQSNVLDMTPGTQGGVFDAEDATLAIGQTFTDATNGIQIRAVRKNLTIPATLDVQVTFTTNLSSLTLDPPTIPGGATSTGTVTLNKPAPTMGAQIALSDNVAATTFPASVTIPAGQTSKTFNITTVVVPAVQNGTLTATYRGVKKTSPVSVQPIVLSSLTLNKSSVGGGGPVTGTVTLNGPAPAGGATVTLSDNIAAATTPANVVVAAGTKTKTFTITTVIVTVSQSGNVTGSYGGVPKSAPLTVAPITLHSLALKPTSVAGGASVTGTVTLNGPAPTGGLVVNLSDNIAGTTVPVSVTFPSRYQIRTFTITTVNVATARSGTVTATLGAATKTAALTVTPVALSSLKLDPASVAGGNNVTGTVSLDGPAPPGGAVVTLSDNLGATATTPASVSLPAGTSSKTFTITTLVVAAKQVGAVTATRGAVTKTTALTVRPVSVQSVTVNPNPIVGSKNATGTITLERLSATSTVVTLSDNLAATTLPASVTVPANTLTKTFSITTTLALPSQSGKLNATANGETRSVNLSVVNTRSQLLLNPGFELGLVSWIANGPNGIGKIIQNSGGPPANSGGWYGWLGGYSVPVSESLHQDVTIPANALSAELNFYVLVGTAETTTTAANDTLKVEIQNTGGTVLATLATYSNLNVAGYVKKTFNLLPYKGQTIRVYFVSAMNTDFASWFFLDDITLDVIQ